VTDGSTPRVDPGSQEHGSYGPRTRHFAFKPNHKQVLFKRKPFALLPTAPDIPDNAEVQFPILSLWE